MKNSIKIELLEDSNSVCILEDSNGRKINKFISIDDFISSIISSTKRDKKENFNPIIGELYREKFNTRLIQSIQLNKNKFAYILFRPRALAPFSIYTRDFGEVGMPSLLFAVIVVNNKFSKLYLTVTDEDNIVTEGSRLFKYPFSNVFQNTGSVCTGSNIIKTDLSIKDNLFNIPDMFFSMPNTAEAFSPNNNALKLTFQELGKKLQGKQFANELLVDNTLVPTYKDWINLLLKL